MTTNLPPNQSQRNPYPCRKCGKTIYWHRAQSGKNYPCDSPTDRKAFHQCEAVAAKPAKPVEPPLTPSYFNPEPSIEQRLGHLEQQVAALVRTVQEVQRRQPISAEDVGF